jgi:hypothetical protein
MIVLYFKQQSDELYLLCNICRSKDIRGTGLRYVQPYTSLIEVKLPFRQHMNTLHPLLMK